MQLGKPDSHRRKFLKLHGCWNGETSPGSHHVVVFQHWGISHFQPARLILYDMVFYPKSSLLDLFSNIVSRAIRAFLLPTQET